MSMSYFAFFFPFTLLFMCSAAGKSENKPLLRQGVLKIHPDKLEDFQQIVQLELNARELNYLYITILKDFERSYMEVYGMGRGYFRCSSGIIIVKRGKIGHNVWYSYDWVICLKKIN